MPGDPERVFASMGNYVFLDPRSACRNCTRTRRTSRARTISDATFCRAWSGACRCTPTIFRPTRFPASRRASYAYWRDVGTIDAYYEANMDMRAVEPELNLYNREWPLSTAGYSDPPAKFVFDEEGRRGQAIDSIVAGGSILSGGVVQRLRAGPLRAGALGCADRGLDRVRQLRYRPAGENPAGDSG